MSSDKPTMPFRMIITTANMVSRASVGFSLPWVITAAMLMTSMKVTERVRINVP
jgi:hypothetical protein